MSAIMHFSEPLPDKSCHFTVLQTGTRARARARARTHTHTHTHTHTRVKMSLRGVIQQCSLPNHVRQNLMASRSVIGVANFKFDEWRLVKSDSRCIWSIIKDSDMLYNFKISPLMKKVHKEVNFTVNLCRDLLHSALVAERTYILILKSTSAQNTFISYLLHSEFPVSLRKKIFWDESL